jgi:hypothetical protein
MVPAPAPTLPRGKTPAVRFSQARRPNSAVGLSRKSRPKRPGSNRTAAGTMGMTWPSPRGQPSPRVLQPAHDPIRRGQTKGAAAGEDDGVDPIHQINRIEEVGFPGAGGGAAHIDPANRAATGEDDRRPGMVGGIMTHLDTGDVRYQIVETGFECVRVGVSHGLERLRG